jgi:hypothetical protein
VLTEEAAQKNGRLVRRFRDDGDDPSRNGMSTGVGSVNTALLEVEHDQGFLAPLRSTLLATGRASANPWSSSD